MNEEELKLLIHLLLMCGVMDKKALENGVITNDEWLQMMKLIEMYQEES